MPLLDTYKFFFSNWHAFFVRQRIFIALPSPSHILSFRNVLAIENVLSVHRKHSHIISDSFAHFDIVFGVLLVSYKPKSLFYIGVWVAIIFTATLLSACDEVVIFVNSIANCDRTNVYVCKCILKWDFRKQPTTTRATTTTTEKKIWSLALINQMKNENVVHTQQTIFSLFHSDPMKIQILKWSFESPNLFFFDIDSRDFFFKWIWIRQMSTIQSESSMWIASVHQRRWQTKKTLFLILPI